MELIDRFPDWLKEPLISFENQNIREIRLKAMRPALVYFDSCAKAFMPKCDITEKLLCELLMRLSDYALPTRESELAEGFITVRGGHRIGICADSVKCGVTGLAFVNIRVAREVKGCASSLYPLFRDGTSMLICGPVGSGKTTIIRDIVRHLSSPPKYIRTVVIDERREIAAMFEGVPQFDVGVSSDVISGKKKAEGIINAVRSLSPQYIVCDEIGSKADIEAIETAKRSGCFVIATIHGERCDLNDFPTGMFDAKVILGRDAGKIISIERTNL